MKLIIGFSRPRSTYAVFGKALMWYDSVPYSHCYIKFTTLTGITLISQASRGMINFMSVPAFDLHNVVVEEFQVEVSKETFQEIKELAMSKAGFPYSTKQIAGILVADVFNLHKNPLDLSKDTFVCSAYLANVCVLLGWALIKHESIMKPSDIYKMARIYCGTH